jgi:LAS superfamily LD-carboxypeptidase LdcB
MRRKGLFFLLLLVAICGQAQIQSKDFLMGKIDYAHHPDFVKLPDHMSSKAHSYLQKVVVDSLRSMFKAAEKEGVHLIVISAARNFHDQKRIWERKWEAQILEHPLKPASEHALHILRYSSMPGTSRHHWGTDFDLNSLEPAYFQKGKGLKEYQWLQQHAESFGFYQPYNNAEGRTGYQEEKWHWSFFPISNELMKSYVEEVQYKDINGFKGCEIAEKIDVIHQFILGVGPAPK